MDLQKELDALHKELEQTNLTPFITQKQVQALAIIMGRCITNTPNKHKKEARIWMLNEIAGNALWTVARVETITSTKNLTGSMASILIDLFKGDAENDWEPSDYAKRLIGALEKRFEAEIRTRESAIG
jgi:hypothetical protein